MLMDGFKKHSPNASAESVTALEVGCAVGRACFELSRTFCSVLGIDYSHAFINAAISLQEAGVSVLLPHQPLLIGHNRALVQMLPYRYATEGRLVAHSRAEVAADIDRSRVHFAHGDACNLPKTFGVYDAILMANLIDRLPDPRSLSSLFSMPLTLAIHRVQLTDSFWPHRKFLDVLPHLVKPGGVVLFTSPYTWLENFTHPSKWLGGYLHEGTLAYKERREAKSLAFTLFINTCPRQTRKCVRWTC